MRARVAALVCVLLLGGACSSPGSDQGSRSRLGEDKSGPRAGGKNKNDKGNGKDKKNEDALGNVAGTAPPPGAVPDVPGTDSDKQGQSTALEPAGEPSDVDPSLARASSTVEEPTPDAEKQGLPPDYSEVFEASIQGLGEDVRMTMTLGGNVPDRMPDDHTYMTAGFALLMGGNEAFSFGAYADDKGWKTYAGGTGRKSGDFPGTFEIEGRQIVMTVPWRYVRGPRAFTWQANSGWFTQIANQTQYAFDVVPNEDGAKFPGH